MADYSLLAAVNLVYDPLGPALICKTCQYALAVSKSQVTSHLWEKHSICPESRRDITPLIRSLEIPNPTELAPRPDHSLAHPYLQIYHGYTCLTCKHRTVNLDTITRHVIYCCPPPRAATAPRRRNPDDLYQEVLLQSWVSGASRKYWIVRRADAHDPLRVFSSSTHLEAVHRRERAYIAARDREAMQETGVKELELTSPWMERTRWAEVYEGAERDLLVRISEVERAHSYDRDFAIGRHKGVNLVSPRADEQKIWQLVAALGRALDRCEETMRHTGHPILCWLKSGSASRFYQKPFGFLGRAASRQRYRRLFQRFLPFVFRAYNMTPTVRRSAFGIRFTGKQLNELRKVWEDDAWGDMNEVPRNTRDDGDFSSDSGSDWDNASEEDEDNEFGEDENEGDDEDEEEGEMEDSDEIASSVDDRAIEDDEEQSRISDGCEDNYISTRTAKVDKLAELVFRLSIFFITEEFADGRPSSSLLVYYSGVLGCAEDGSTFRRPKDYTSFLSALIYVQRLLLLEFALPYRAYAYVDLPRRSQRGHLERLNEVRLQCMVFGCLTPMGEFLSLRSLGRKLARSDTPSFLVRWSEDGRTLFYNDTSISMEGFAKFGHSLVRQTEALCNTLMFNWLPEVDLSRLRDDMSNKRQGYSFIQHPANGLSTAYLNLSTRACTAQGDGLVRKEGWDLKAVSEYLRMTEDCQSYLGSSMLTLGGQGPRATEILSLECCNGQSTERGIYAYNGFMIYVIRHHKAKKSTKNEFIVNRFLPSKVGKMLYYYLVYIRPFAAMLQREVFGRKFDSSLLFCSPQAPQRPWHSSRLTAVLMESSSRVFEKPINIRLYRQLSISITEKHVKKLAKPFNRYDDESATADPNVVFAWQSGHRPRQRATTYGLDGAFPSRMQPALLNIYEWASVEWHQYLGHRSRSDAPLHQLQPTPGESTPLETLVAIGRKGRQPSKRQPMLAKPDNPMDFSFVPPLTPSTSVNYRFKAPMTQDTFAIPATRDVLDVQRPVLDLAPLKCSLLPHYNNASGQKRKFGEIAEEEHPVTSKRHTALPGPPRPQMDETPRNRETPDISTCDDQSKIQNQQDLWMDRRGLESRNKYANGDDNNRDVRELAEQRVLWNPSAMNRPDEDTFYIHGKRLLVLKLRGAVHDMLSDAENVLWRDLMWTKRQEERFELDLSTMQDDLSLRAKGESWVTNKANGLTGGEGWMFDRMVRSPKNKRLCEGDSWNMDKIQQYTQVRRRFLELLLVLFQIVNAPPAGGDEITGITHRNGIGQVACATWCAQTTKIFGGTKAAIRFLPWRVGQLLAVYLVYVRPFSEELDYQTSKIPRTDYLWHDKSLRWTRQHLTKALSVETSSRLGVRLTIQDYQNLAVRMGCRYIGADFSRCLPRLDLLSKESSDGDLSVDRVNFAVLEIMESLYYDDIQRSKAVSSQWHMLLGLASVKPQS